MLNISDQTMMDHSRQQKNDLEQAKQIVEQHLALDTCVITLNEKCARSAVGVVTLSGGTEQDYPNVLEMSRGLMNINQVQTVHKTPLPPEILEHIKHMKANCMMGIFQEIGRAWLTVDSDIYIWTFERSGDVRYFSASCENILAVGLVKPCANVFTSCIQYLLILSTISETIFIGVASENDNNKNKTDLTLISEPIFTISNDGVITNVIKTTDTGRVFLGGKDGSLYEIIYKSENSWFGRRFKRVNHHSSKLSFFIPAILTSMVEVDPIVSISIDERRNILYCLTQNSSIEVFDLGESGDEMKSVARMSHAQISRCARSVLPVINESLYQHIIEVIPVSQEECNVYHMVAMTGSGVRLYFTTGYERSRPFKLQMMHIRLPPGYSPRSSHSRPSQAHTALYKKGNYLMLTSDTPDHDSLWCLSIDNFPFHNQLVESVTRLPLDGPTWTAAELKHTEDNMTVLRDPMIASAPLVVSQHLQTPRRWVILSPQGCHIVSLLRPVDVLKQLLINSQGAANEAVKYYFESQPDAQACATSLVLACLESQSSPQIMEWATQAFFLYGGYPQKINCPSQDMQNASMINKTRYDNTFAPYVASTPMHGFQLMNSPGRYQAQPPQSPTLMTPRNNLNYMSPDTRKPGSTSMIQFSTKHIGLNLYFSRILRPLWNRNCVQKVVTESGKHNLLSVLTKEDCEVILYHLYTLGQFLNKHMSITGLKKTCGLPVGADSNATFGVENLDPYMQEKTQLETMLKFLAHVCEVLNLWKILIEHRFHLIAAEIPEDMQERLAEFTFKDLFVLGYGVCVAMIISLINSYLSNNADVENISTRLRKLCPTLYRSEDAACSKANEILLKIIADNKKPKREIHPDDRDDMIQLALDLCKRVVPDLCLHAVCPQFAAAEGYYALVHLCSASAKALDPNGIALAHYKNREPQEDIQGSQMLSERMKMYREIILALEHLVQFVDKPNNASTEFLPNASKHIEHIIKLVLQNEDELLHISVYEWMLNHDMLGEIIPHASPSLASYLESVLTRKPEYIQVCELLYKYYEIHGEHITAAKLLYNLAVSQNVNMTLSERVRYMGRAVMSLRNNKTGFTTQNGLFMRDIEDKIEIAAIQQKVIDNIQLMKSQIQDVDNILSILNKRLFDVTQLYQDFADPLNLYEAKLALLKCSDHNDPRLIESVWSNILDQQLHQAEEAPLQYRMEKVLLNIKPLITQYRSTPYCLPLVFITRKLEILSCRTGGDCSQVSRTLLQSGITLENIYETYNHILHSNDRCWSHEGNELYFLQACAQVVERFIEQKSSLSYKTRIKLTTVLQDFVSSCINTAMSISATESQSIVQQFRSLQTQLSR